MIDFVIYYLENIGFGNIEYKVIWLGTNAESALKRFWLSFDKEDRKKISNVRIFKLVPKNIDTRFKEGENNVTG